MDMNQLYFDYQVSLMRAQSAATARLRRSHEIEAAQMADRIRNRQVKLGAAAACTWLAPTGLKPA